MRDGQYTYGRARAYMGRSSRDGGFSRIFSTKRIETMGNQLIVACVIGLAVIIISNLKVSITDNILSKVKWAVSENYDFKAETAGLWNNAVPGIEKKFNELYGSIGTLFNSNKPQEVLSSSLKDMRMPVDGEITSTFGPRKDPDTGETVQHSGIDIAASEGTPILAALDGTISEVGENNSMGKYVKIEHDGNVETVYEHCSEILVSKSQAVKKGDTIAKVGKTGDADGAHLHFEVLEDGKQVDPLGIISDAEKQEE